MALKAKKGTLTTKLAVRDNVSKKEVHLEEENTRVEAPRELVGDIPLGMVRVVDSVKLSYDYQSIGIDIGLDMPWQMRPGHLEDIEAGFAFAEDFVDKRLAEKAEGLPATLQRISRRR